MAVSPRPTLGQNPGIHWDGTKNAGVNEAAVGTVPATEAVLEVRKDSAVLRRRSCGSMMLISRCSALESASVYCSPMV